MAFFRRDPPPPYLPTEQAIQQEIAIIEGREPPPVQSPDPLLTDEDPDTVRPVRASRRAEPQGELEAQIRSIMGTPPEHDVASDHEPDRRAGARRPPGGGAGMVNTGAHGPLFALCLSGGGIRSAALCLGAVQMLARYELLARFHYVSTVAGGGYTGGLIARLIHTAGGVVPAEKRLAFADADHFVPWLQNLRSYTSFLAPRLSA